jgi:formylmethanofuran dehydrogenase subunit E
MARFDIIGNCDECDGEILEEDCFKIIDDNLLCPECYEEAVSRGDINREDYDD